MIQITDQEAFHFLSQAGFTQAEIKRLCRFRRDYQMSYLDQSSLDLRRLEFVRWLVTTGRIADGLPEAPQPAPPAKDTEQEQRVTSRVRWTSPFFWRKELYISKRGDAVFPKGTTVYLTSAGPFYGRKGTIHAIDRVGADGVSGRSSNTDRGHYGPASPCSRGRGLSAGSRQPRCSVAEDLTAMSQCRFSCSMTQALHIHRRIDVPALCGYLCPGSHYKARSSLSCQQPC